MWRKALLPVRLIIYYHLAYWAFSRFQGQNLFRPCIDPDAWHHPVEYARGLGYDAETHLVTTPDEVVLEVHRIKARGSATGNQQRVPIILQHGLMGASSGWIANPPDQSLGFILADAGYDVWLANSRGNTYSKRSASTKADFWAFTKDDLSLIDAPTTIDYVLTTTGSKFVHFVGHSQGGFILMALLSERPEYAEKIGLGVGLAPVLTLTHAQPRVQNIYRFYNMLRWLPHFEMFSNQRFPANLIMNPVVCRFAQGMCSWILDVNAGSHPSQFNTSRMGVYAGGMPAGSSFANVRHYSQTLLHGRFAKFDYGPEENLRRYKQKESPDYDLARVSGKVALFYSEGDNDAFAGAGHNEWLVKSLPKKSLVHHEAVKDFQHMDFQLGIGAKQILYDKLIKLLRAHEK